MNRFKIASRVDGWLKPEVRKARKILSFGDTASREEVVDFRNQAFRDLVGHCYQNIPYYRDMMQKLRIHPKDIRGLEDISLFPVLTKDIVRQEGIRLRNPEMKEGSYVIRRSGGTTGEPIPSYVNTLAAALETYSYFRGLQWMGWNPNQKRILLSGGSLGLTRTRSLRFKLKSYATGIISLPAFELTSENLSTYVKVIQNAGPCIITGYASVLKYLSDLCTEKNIRLKNVYQIFSTAELLPDDWRESISNNLGVPVKCFYGCGEVNSLGFQLESNGVYKIPWEHVHLESAFEVEGVEDQSLLTTSLFNYAQPLIRYANGDLGIVNEDKDGMVIEKLKGRTSDMFLRRDGSKLSSSFGPHSIFMSNVQVKKYQFVQRELDLIEFLYDPISEDIADQEKETIRRMVFKVLGEDVKVVFNKTNEFLLSKNNKHRIMICMVNQMKTPRGK